VYAVIAYYLKNRTAVDAYTSEDQCKEGEEVRRKTKAAHLVSTFVHGKEQA
jgi:hypothetical protein